jgi:hypothetical protein
LLGWAEPILIAGGRAVEHSTEVFVGIDVAKARNAIAVADGERGGEVRYLGEVEASSTAMARVVQRLAAKHARVHFCYEAGPTGYGLHRLITSLGHPCTVVAPSLIPKRSGDRVKTNRRDVSTALLYTWRRELRYAVEASKLPPRNEPMFVPVVRDTSLRHGGRRPSCGAHFLMFCSWAMGQV